jgi:hypothetical protein
MGVPDRLLALMGEQGEDGGNLCNSSLAASCLLDGLFPKASDRMVPEIACRGLVLRILIVPNPTKTGLALPSCAWEEVAHAIVMVLNRDTIGLKEAIYWGVPSPFQSLCNAWP